MMQSRACCATRCDAPHLYTTSSVIRPPTASSAIWLKVASGLGWAVARALTVTANRLGEKVETKTVSDAAGDIATTTKVDLAGVDKEASVRDRISGVTHHSRTRSGSPRGSWGGYRGLAYWDGALSSLSGRPADLVATDPVWRAAHVDGGEYRSATFLDAPLYRRGAYLGDSLARRGAYLDDPLFARRGAYLDDPLYRRSAYLDDPLYRRSAFLDDPLYRGSVGDPLLSRRAYLDDVVFRRGAFLDDPSNWRVADPYTVGSGRPFEMRDAFYRSTGRLDADPRVASPRRRAEELRSLPLFI